jgi:thioredoxin
VTNTNTTSEEARVPIDLIGALDNKLADMDVTVLIDFWAKWCGPCKVMMPHLSTIQGEFAGRLAVLKVDVDQHPDLLARYGIQAVPTLVVWVPGKGEVARMARGASLPVLREFVAPWIAPAT